ncbi:hypothetical protein R6Y95_06140 [Methanoculleus palmolei]|uniref:HEPN domain-containing protein n=1 Tax=Methanoculleus palmolei TaxID=72612 RepID=A0ABD8A7Q4_9EURY|nr:hypothetical protein R6Y95_06140 [Methanoculleus palmolei]
MGDERDVPYFGDIRTPDEAIAWLRQASETCSEVAKYITNPEQAAYQRGRAHAFGLAAGIVESALGRGQE